VPGAVLAATGVGSDVRIAIAAKSLLKTRSLDLLQAALLLGRDAGLRQRAAGRDGLSLILRAEDRSAKVARQRRSKFGDAGIVAGQTCQAIRRRTVFGRVKFLMSWSARRV
jgi:hypothetical protein